MDGWMALWLSKPVIASPKDVAIHGAGHPVPAGNSEAMGCRVATLLAMTEGEAPRNDRGEGYSQ